MLGRRRGIVSALSILFVGVTLSLSSHQTLPTNSCLTLKITVDNFRYHPNYFLIMVFLRKSRLISWQLLWHFEGFCYNYQKTEASFAGWKIHSASMCINGYILLFSILWGFFYNPKILFLYFSVSVIFWCKSIWLICGKDCVLIFGFW